MAAVEQLFENNQGRMGSFAFVDPWDGTAYPNCSLADDFLSVKSVAEMRREASLTVVENRS
jgi:hypothetical protein